MPNFKYRVRDRSGKAMAGSIDAPNLQMAGDRLYQLGYFPINIEEEGETVSLNLSGLWERFQKVQLDEIFFFSQQLSISYKAGVPLLTEPMSLTQVESGLSFCVAVLSPMHLPLVHRRP